MYINFKSFEKYLQELECEQIDRQIEFMNTFQLYTTEAPLTGILKYG